MRFQPKFRRRRECKTDYRARRILILQDKNKYNTPKFRFVVRITNKNVICQIINAKMIGDEILSAAYSHELSRHGLDVGLTNWSACYATGLLCARRLLKKLEMDKIYQGNKNISGEFFLNEREESLDEENIRNPFCAYLDVGLRRTTTGARIFASMKGATDGGIYIPHNENGKQFPGWRKEEGSGIFKTEKCRHYIFGGHVADYMKKLQEENLAKYKDHFSRYIKKDINADNLEKLYEKIHLSIRENPEASQKIKSNKNNDNKYRKKLKKTYAERRDHIINKILTLKNKSMK